MKLHRLSSMILAGAVTACGASWANGTMPPAYNIIDLGTPGTESRAYGINDSGDIAGEAHSTSNSLWHATVWTNGVASHLGTFGGTTSVAWDITNDGRVVGRADLQGGGKAHAFLYESGVMKDLGVLAESYSFAREISESGQIVGGFQYAYNKDHAFLWQNGSMTDLDRGATTLQSQAFAINASGQIVGERANTACLWENGAPTSLGILPGFVTSTAYDINDAGHVIGFCGNGGAAFLWKNSVMTNLGSLGGQTTFAHAINNHDQVVGQATTASGTCAFIWESGMMVDLNNLLKPNSKWMLWDARDINDSGQIVGCGVNPDGLWHAYRLDPVPEPGTIALLASGAIGLLAWAWRRRRKLHRLSPMILVAAVLAFAVVAQAAPITIPTVPVGNPGNANDSTGYGKVDYDYRIGTYEVTNTQYTAFLNAADAGGTNPNGIYNPSMGSEVMGGITYTAGNSNGSKYAVKAGMGYMPVTYVSFWDACRFANWLHNGQGAVSTETGAYTLTPTGIANNTTTRNADWKWAVASENEWYKAAYHQPVAQGGDADNYWLYPTATNSVPYSDKPGSLNYPANSANYYNDDGNSGNGYNDGYAVTGSTSYVSTQNYLTDVGAYTQSHSFYGTFDQGGNVWEWNEAIIAGSSSSRGLRGGYWSDRDSYPLSASFRGYGDPANVSNDRVGFRVANVPEPGSIILLVSGAIGLLAYAWRRRWKLHGLSPMILAGAVATFAVAAQAVTIDMAPVGNPGNAGELSGSGAGGNGPNRICGAVDYAYNIGKYEVTAGEYTAFLNAVGGVDTYALYNTDMSNTSYGSGIARSGGGIVGDPYAYTVATNFANRPVNFVSYWDACRFANWLHNGQPTGAQGAGTTETGAYTLTTAGMTNNTIVRNANWK